jgi:iron-sulfur cluster assembly protein
MVVTLSERAAREVKRMMAEQQSPAEPVLRVEVVGGGCSGYEYRLAFVPSADNVEDVVGESHGVRIAVDKKSAKFLSGMEIDIGDGLNKRGFMFNNPLATRTCGCGTSFQV